MQLTDNWIEIRIHSYMAIPWCAYIIADACYIIASTLQPMRDESLYSIICEFSTNVKRLLYGVPICMRILWQYPTQLLVIYVNCFACVSTTLSFVNNKHRVSKGLDIATDSPQITPGCYSGLTLKAKSVGRLL